MLNLVEYLIYKKKLTLQELQYHHLMGDFVPFVQLKINAITGSQKKFICKTHDN